MRSSMTGSSVWNLHRIRSISMASCIRFVCQIHGKETTVICSFYFCAVPKGYDYDDIRLSAQRRGYIAHIPHRGVAPSIRRRGQKAHRWVIERTNRWHNLFRRLKIRYEVHARNYLAFVHLANAIICFRRAREGRGGLRTHSKSKLKIANFITEHYGPAAISQIPIADNEDTVRFARADGYFILRSFVESVNHMLIDKAI